MAQYNVFFLNSAGAVIASEEFDAAPAVDAGRIVPLLWNVCADEFSGFEVWQGNRKIAERIDPTLPKITSKINASNALLGGRELISVSPPLLGQPRGTSRRRIIRSFAIGAVVVLGLSGTFGATRECVWPAKPRNAKTNFGHPVIENAGKAATSNQRSSGVNEAPTSPKAQAAQNDAMLRGLANYQRLMFESSTAEEVGNADRTIAAPKPAPRFRRRPIRSRVEVWVPRTKSSYYDYWESPAYTAR